MRTTRRRRAPVVGAIAALLLGVLWAGGARGAEPGDSVDGPPSASGTVLSERAGPVSAGRHVLGVLPRGSTWAGALAHTGGLPGVADSALYWCVQSGLVAPTGPVHPTGSIEDPRLAYLLTRFQDDTARPLELVRAALAAEVHIRHDVGTSTLPAAQNRERWAAAIGGHHGDVQAVLDAYRADAAANAGPYVASVEIEPAPDGRTAVVRSALVGGAGVPVTGLAYALHVEGDAAWAGGGADLAVTTDGTRHEAVLTARSTGDVTVTLTAAGLPSTTLVVGRPSDPRQQSVVAVTAPVAVSASASARLRYDFAVAGVSAVDRRVVDPGGVLGDTLLVTATAEAQWIEIEGAPVPVTFTAVAYAAGPVPLDAPEAAVPAGARVLARAEVVAYGPGAVVAPAVEASEPGAVTWVWSMAVADQPERYRRYLAGDWSDAYGLADETTLVRSRADVVSALTVLETRDGPYVLDYQWVTGAPADHGEYPGGLHWGPDLPHYVSTLHFVPGVDPPGPGSCTPQTVVGEAVEVDLTTGVKPAVGSTTWLVDPGAVGTWVVVHHFDGDDRTMPFDSPCDDPAQWFRTLPQPLRMTTTAMSAHPVVLGEPAVLRDAVAVEGVVPEGAQTRFELYQWPVGADPVCTGDTLVATQTVPSVSGGFDSPDFEVDTVGGTLGFVQVTLLDGVPVAAGVCGEESETVVPEQPAPGPEGPREGGAEDAGPSGGDVPTARLPRTGAHGLMVAAVAGGLVAAGGAVLGLRHAVGRR